MRDGKMARHSTIVLLSIKVTELTYMLSLSKCNFFSNDFLHLRPTRVSKIKTFDSVIYIYK